jgi:hypothetical protein
LQIASAPISGPGRVDVPVLISSYGSENSLGFSISFSPALLQLKEIKLADGISGGSLYVNSAKAAYGKAGVVLALPANAALAPGLNKICWLSFEVLSATGTADVSFANDPVRCEVVDKNVASLPGAYASGQIVISSQTSASLLQQIEAGRLELSFPAIVNGRYAIQRSSDLASWSEFLLRQATGLTERVSLSDVMDAPRFFYRVVPVQ